MAFAILKSNGLPVSYRYLNKEAAEFWNVPISDFWASPLEGRGDRNWVSVIGVSIGWPIIAKNEGWNGVKCSMLTYLTHDLALCAVDSQIERIESHHVVLEPYYKLVDYWASKGYIPQYIPGDDPIQPLNLQL
jgi:hypothetical protein